MSGILKYIFYSSLSWVLILNSCPTQLGKQALELGEEIEVFDFELGGDGGERA